MCSPLQNSNTFSMATGPSGKPEEGRGRCPYDPYQKNTAITVGKNPSSTINVTNWHRLYGLFHSAYAHSVFTSASVTSYSIVTVQYTADMSSIGVV